MPCAGSRARRGWDSSLVRLLACVPDAARHLTCRCGGGLLRLMNHITELAWSSPKGKFVGYGKEVSEELGRKPQSTDLNERQPFDVEICRIPPGKTPCNRSATAGRAGSPLHATPCA